MAEGDDETNLVAQLDAGRSPGRWGKRGRRGPGLRHGSGGVMPAIPYDEAADLVAMYAFSDGVTGVAQPSAVRRLGVRIEIYQSDDLRERDQAGLPRACVSQACEIYAKTCSDDGLRCEWDWGGASDNPRFVTDSLWIDATSRGAMDSAVHAISAQWWSGKDLTVLVPLSTMAQRSDLNYVRPCEGEVQSDCINLLGRVPEANGLSRAAEARQPDRLDVRVGTNTRPLPLSARLPPRRRVSALGQSGHPRNTVMRSRNSKAKSRTASVGSRPRRARCSAIRACRSAARRASSRRCGRGRSWPGQGGDQRRRRAEPARSSAAPPSGRRRLSNRAQAGRGRRRHGRPVRERPTLYGGHAGGHRRADPRRPFRRRRRQVIYIKPARGTGRPQNIPSGRFFLRGRSRSTPG